MTGTEPRSGAELFAEALSAYGVRHVFGNPGTTELPVIEAVADVEGCDYVMTLHEDVAVGMAAGYAKTSQYHAHRGKSVTPVGVANLHAAPGLAHGLGNLHGASYAGAAVVVTAGIQETAFRHHEPILSGDLVEMTRQFTKWSASVDDVGALPSMLRRAFRTALSPPTGPVFLGFPLDVVQAETDARVEPLGEIPAAGPGDPRRVERAAGRIAEAVEPVMVVGDGVARSGRDAVDAAVRLAEAAGMRVHGEILAAEVSFPGDHDLWHSFVPPDEDVARRHMDADLLLFVGCSTNTTITAPGGPLVPSDATCIHVGDDPWQLGKNERADVVVLGEPGAVLSELADALEDCLSGETRRARLERVRRYGDESSDRSADQASSGDPPTRETLVDALREVAPDALVVDESVTTKYVLLDRWPLQPGQFLGTKGGGLGYGLPAAVGAAVAEATWQGSRDVLAVIGDGSFLYYPQALYTAARYGVELTVVVPNNRSYAVLRDNAVELLGGGPDDHDFESMGIDMVPTVDVPGMAGSQGFHTTIVEDPDSVAPAVEEAMAHDRALVDVVVGE